ncbi:MAG: protein-glutamate O-methyltransferase CheR [Myxococcales bacterium]|nr:protein-glutamate O-methyltransferase CheR [Myxococcales bacterium]
MSVQPTRLEMTDAEFRMFCKLLRDRCGLHFDTDMRFLVEKRLARRVAKLELGSFAAYRYYLRNGQDGDEEFAGVIDDLTTNETYFFRERRQLNALVNEIIPEQLLRKRHAGSREPVNIWSAGCSSGEEPLSIVMLGLEANLRPGRDFRVYASDISRLVLRKARKGVYREASFRETESILRAKYFSDKDDLSQVSEAVRKEVDFVQINLLDRSKVSLLGTMDTIMCRNVIIYFDLATKKEVIQTFHDKLVPGGYLLLGHSESLINVTNAFEFAQLKEDLVYRRPGLGSEVSDSWQALAEAAIDETDREGGIA